ncbi:MAG: response regulator [Oligoflexales bacterium]
MAKILVIDDAMIQRAQLKSMVVATGHEAVEAGDGEEGLEMALKHRDELGLIFCDFNMPVLDGLSLCTKLHEDEQFPSIPFFMITTETSQDLKELGKKVGVKGWIIKPFQPSVIEQLIRQFV